MNHRTMIKQSEVFDELVANRTIKHFQEGTGVE